MNSGTQELPDSVTQQSGQKGLVQFGVFELNMQTGELRKSGVRIRLQGKPFQILQALLERPGEVVTRDELRKRLWPADTFVDFESGLNTAANRLRLTLGDSAENPRYIQTLSRTGYRFIASVSDAPARPDSPATAEAPPEAIEPPVATAVPSAPSAPPAQRNQRLWLILGGAAALVILLAGVMYLTRRNGPSEVSFRQVTFRRGYVNNARFAPDGQTVLYAAHWNTEPLGNYMVSPGSPESRSLGIADFHLLSVSKSGELALSNKRSLYRVPMNGGSPKLFLEGVCCADWMPNGDLAIVRQEGGETKLEFPRGRAVFQTAGYVSDVRVSPSGDAVAFLDHPVSFDDGGNVIWIDAGGTIHRVSEGWASEEGLAWAPNGREVWFTASRTGINRSLYAVGRSGAVRRVASIPGIMTLHDISPRGQVLVGRETVREVMWLGKAGESGSQTGSEREKDISWFDFSHPVEFSPDGSHLLFTEGGEGGGREYGVYIRDLSTGATTRLSEGDALAFLPDGKSVLAMLPRENNHLSIVPIGAGQPRSVAAQGFAYQTAQVFPDGQKLLVSGSMPGKAARLYTQSVEGGPLTPIDPEIALEFLKISPDGTRIAGSTRVRKCAIIPAGGGTPQYLPIDGIAIPVKWSADSRKLLIRTEDKEGMTLLEWVELATGKTTLWRKLRDADDEMIDTPMVSRDETTYVYSSQRRTSELFVVDGWQ